MNTKNCMKAKITGVLLGAASLLMAGSVNAARVDILPVNTPVGDPITLTVTGSEFPLNGVTAGSVAVNWDPAVLSLNTTVADAIGDGATTGFTDVLQFTATSGQLLFAAAVNLLLPPVAVGGGSFDFLHLSFNALVGTETNISIGVNAIGGPWQDGAGSDITAVTYTGATIGAVPVPAAIWLFGSGLIGMIAISRRRKPQLVC